MKNKLLLLNIISYIVLYHLVYEFIAYNSFYKYEGLTPLGYLFSKFDRFEMDYFLILVISFIINMSVSGILLRYIYKWDGKISFLQLFKKLLLVFVMVSVLLILLLCLLAVITNGMIFFIFINFYFPMPIMVILMLPLFRLNKIILEDES